MRQARRTATGYAAAYRSRKVSSSPPRGIRRSASADSLTLQHAIANNVAISDKTGLLTALQQLSEQSRTLRAGLLEQHVSSKVCLFPL
jgi:hypothetical protein